MTIEECYSALGGNYQQALGRLMNDNLIKRFVMKFPADKSYDNMVAAMNARDTDTAFREAHTLKGVCRNLAFDRLDSSVSEITEHLRAGDLAPALEMLPRVTADYELVIDTIKKL
ncbi:MAG: Hpt domain-containing protein [Selenomonadaceae bacterium]|nr:Hpt domain-containing protein [Selenomonadaceae bacterium]